MSEFHENICELNYSKFSGEDVEFAEAKSYTSGSFKGTRIPLTDVTSDKSAKFQIELPLCKILNVKTEKDTTHKRGVRTFFGDRSAKINEYLSLFPGMSFETVPEIFNIIVEKAVKYVETHIEDFTLSTTRGSKAKPNFEAIAELLRSSMFFLPTDNSYVCSTFISFFFGDTDESGKIRPTPITDVQGNVYKIGDEKLQKKALIGFPTITVEIHHKYGSSEFRLNRTCTNFVILAVDSLNSSKIPGFINSNEELKKKLELKFEDENENEREDSISDNEGEVLKDVEDQEVKQISENIRDIMDI